MKPHEDRVIKECAELSDRLHKLNNFIYTAPAFQVLPMGEQANLRAQSQAMEEYKKLLELRIVGFSIAPNEDVPRRCRVDLSPAEYQISKAIAEVESLPADARLTEAVVLLGKAQASVAEYVDSILGGQEAKKA